MTVQLTVSENSGFRGDLMVGPPSIDQDVTPGVNPTWSAAVPVELTHGAERLYQIKTTEDIEVAIVRGNGSPSSVSALRLILPSSGLMINTGLLSLPGSTVTFNFYFRTAV